MAKHIFWEAEPRVVEAQTADWTIPAIVRERMVRDAGAAIYFVPEGEGFRPVSWRAFGTAIAEIGAGLGALGFGRGERAAVMGEPTLEWVECDFGALVPGGTTVGIYQISSWQEVAHVIAEARPMVFFGQKRAHLDCGLRAAKPLGPVRLFVQMEGEVDGLVAPDAEARIITLAELRRIGAAALAAEPALFDAMVDRGQGSDVARIIFTSGTTGRPKGVMYTHKAWLLVGEQWVMRFPPIRQRPHVHVAFLSTAHVSSAMVTEIVPLVSKLQPHFAPEKAELVEVFRRARPEVIGMTPRFYQKIAVQLALKQQEGSTLDRLAHRLAMGIGRRVVDEYWRGVPSARWRVLLLDLARRTLFRRLRATVGLDRVKRAQTGSAMMPVDVAALWAIWGMDIREAYGLSEAACAVCYQQRPFPKPGTIGRLMDNQPDSDLRLAEDGEILFKSPMVFSGYWEQPEATAKALKDGWFHTGDIAERTPDGDLRLVGRKNDAISTAGGKTINPAEIENAMKLSPFISEAVVFGQGEKYLVALIEIERDRAARWARDEGLSASTYAELVAAPQVEQLIAAEVANANARFGRVLQVKQFRIIPQPLDSVADALTSAKKVKRRVVRETFHDLVESMYDRKEEAILAAPAGRR
ncbi:AMP-binding protein [Xanthobacter sp. KR7-225]|uniref:AMP-dependent synthetase/ligase n=1 Tax=Xanthobacter sp. KR7-225 TaxID=3156613 RepID=UPI0032B48860